MKKTFRILEIVWLVMACVGVIMSAFSFVSGDNRGGIFFLGFTFVAGLIYSVRRKQRIKYENSEQQKEQKIK